MTRETEGFNSQTDRSFPWSKLSRHVGFCLLGFGFIMLAVIFWGVRIGNDRALNRFLLYKGPLVCREFVLSELEFEFPQLAKQINRGRLGTSIVMTPGIVASAPQKDFTVYFDNSYLNEFSVFKNSIENKQFAPSTRLEFCGHQAPESIVAKEMISALKIRPILRGQILKINNQHVLSQNDTSIVPSAKATIIFILAGIVLIISTMPRSRPRIRV